MNTLTVLDITATVADIRALASSVEEALQVVGHLQNPSDARPTAYTTTSGGTWVSTEMKLSALPSASELPAVLNTLAETAERHGIVPTEELRSLRGISEAASRLLDEIVKEYPLAGGTISRDTATALRDVTDLIGRGDCSDGLRT